MTWGGWSEFLEMGGYALYVWGSYAVTLGLMVMEIMVLVLRGRDARAQRGRPRGPRNP